MGVQLLSGLDPAAEAERLALWAAGYQESGGPGGLLAPAPGGRRTLGGDDRPRRPGRESCGGQPGRPGLSSLVTTGAGDPPHRP